MGRASIAEPGGYSSETAHARRCVHRTHGQEASRVDEALPRADPVESPADEPRPDRSVFQLFLPPDVLHHFCDEFRRLEESGSYGPSGEHGARAGRFGQRLFRRRHAGGAGPRNERLTALQGSSGRSSAYHRRFAGFGAGEFFAVGVPGRAAGAFLDAHAAARAAVRIFSVCQPGRGRLPGNGHDGGRRSQLVAGKPNRHADDLPADAVSERGNVSFAILSALVAGRFSVRPGDIPVPGHAIDFPDERHARRELASSSQPGHYNGSGSVSGHEVVSLGERRENSRPRQTLAGGCHAPVLFDGSLPIEERPESPAG